MFHINKIINGNETRHVTNVGNRIEEARECLFAMASGFIKAGIYPTLHRWALEIPKGEVYRIVNESLEAR